MRDILEELLPLSWVSEEDADVLREMFRRARGTWAPEERSGEAREEGREEPALRSDAQGQGEYGAAARTGGAEDAEDRSAERETAALERLSRSMERQRGEETARGDREGAEEENALSGTERDGGAEGWTLGGQGESARALSVQLGRTGRVQAYVRREHSGAQTVRQADMGWTRPGETAAARAEDVRRVDRAFERDARRYDCGFTLF